MAVFYSFHYDRDSWRVQEIINMGVVEGQQLLDSQDWESVRRQGQQAIQNWIDRQMKGKEAVVVLVGAETASRPWVEYEIRQAWKEKLPLVGVHIHGLKDRESHTDRIGPDPFSRVKTDGGTPLSAYVTVHDPLGWDSQSVYSSIKTNLKTWVASAYRRP
jgi:hypothetical protein